LTRPKSILFLTYHFPPEVGGIQTRIAHYLKVLRDRKIRTTVFYAVSHRGVQKSYDLNGTRVVVSLGRTSRLPQNAATLVRLMASQRVEAVHVFTGMSTFLSTFALAIGRLKQMPAVVSVFGLEEFEFVSFRQRLLFNLSIRLATCIAVNSAFTRSHFPPSVQAKTRVILGGAVGPRDPTEHMEDSEAARILYVGRLVRSKGIDDLIESYKIVSERIPQSTLVIVGDGPERGRLESLVHELDLSTSVVFKGTLRGEKLDEEYANCTVFAMASKRVPDDPAIETFGLTLVEALMHGKPVVGTFLGGIPEIVENGVNGLLVSEGQPRELADALVRILTDRDLACKLRQNALESAKRKFTWEAATDRLLSCYSRGSQE